MNRDEMSSIAHVYRKADATRGEPVVISSELICQGFGLEWGETWVYMQAEDSKGNKAATSHLLPIPAVDEVLEASGC